MTSGGRRRIQTVPPSTFSSLLFINECLLDEARTSNLRTAISQTVKEGDIVVDAGTGSGVLALFAAAAGARKVYAVDVDLEAIALAQRSIGTSAYADRIELVESDLNHFALREPADVVIMEMLDTGLIAEQQAPALNAMRRHMVIGPQTRVLPERAICTVELVQYNFDFYGFTMPLVIQARNSGIQHRVERELSARATYRDIDFGRPIATTVDELISLQVERDGLLNALRLKTQTVLCDGLAIWETSDMNMPVILPVAPMEVRQGLSVNVAIHYSMGSGYACLVVHVSE